MWRMMSALARAPQHRQLAFIDAHRAIFAGMIHPDHRFGVGRRAGLRRVLAYAAFCRPNAVPSDDCVIFDNPNAPSAAIAKEQMAL